jgi:hypothetical protein
MSVKLKFHESATPQVARAATAGRMQLWKGLRSLVLVVAPTPIILLVTEPYKHNCLCDPGLQVIFADTCPKFLQAHVTWPLSAG